MISCEFYSECQGWRLTGVLFSRSISFDGPFFILKSGSITECNLRDRCKNVQGGGRGGGTPYKSDGGACQKISRTHQDLVLWACLLQIIF